MRGIRGTGGFAETTIRRREAPRTPPPPFPRGKRWRSPGLFLFPREEVRMDPDPVEGQEGGGGVGGNERISDADDANEKDAMWSFISFSSEKETKEPWSPASSSPGDDV